MDRRDEIRRGLSIAEDAVVVVEVARLIPDKCIEETLAAVARARSLTSRPLHLLIVGNGPLRAPRGSGGSARSDRDLHRVSRRRAAALSATPPPTSSSSSRAGSHGCTVVNEAAAFGLPLVLADTVGAAADLLEPGRNGALVRNGDLGGQAGAIAELADDDKLRERAGRRSAEIVSSWGYEPSIEPFVAAVRRAARGAR